MKKFALIATALLLSACTPKATPVSLMFDMAFKPALDATHVQELTQAAGRTIQGRVESMGGTATDIQVTNVSNAGGQIAFTLAPEELLTPLMAQLSVPYKLRLLREAKPGETATVTVEAAGTTPERKYRETGVSEADIEWVAAAPDTTNASIGTVYVTFTAAGKEKVKKVFSSTKGMYVGLFVHDRLISSFVNTNGEARENIIIDGVPAVELASAFADDVNVGTFVTFTKK